MRGVSKGTDELGIYFKGAQWWPEDLGLVDRGLGLLQTPPLLSLEFHEVGHSNSASSGGQGEGPSRLSQGRKRWITQVGLKITHPNHAAVGRDLPKVSCFSLLADEFSVVTSCPQPCLSLTCSSNLDPTCAARGKD